MSLRVNVGGTCMVVLRAIGRFFARIGRWIRDTAWVQPLLIVGGIFAIIFSIPYITKWVKSWGNDDTVAYVKYYEKKQISLESCDTKDSKVDKLFQYMVDFGEGKETADQVKEFGTKFFLSFVQKGCSGCETNYEGLKYLEDNYKSNSLLSLGNDKFSMYSIFMDETDDDIDYDGNLFDHYIADNYSQVFETVSEYTTSEGDYWYLINQGGKDSSYYESAAGMADQMTSPTIFLMEMTDDYRGTFGVSEVLFTYSAKKNQGTTSYAKALTLADCWNHADIFSDSYIA